MDIVEAISRLSATPGASGHEFDVGKIAAGILEPLVDSVEIDAFGNVIARQFGPSPDSPRLVLDAHLDEIGLMITGQTEGFLRFRTIGGVDARMLPAREVIIASHPPVRGVIMTMPPHILKEDEADKAIKVEDMLIDAGLDEARAKMLIGKSAVYAEKPVMLKNNRLSCKAMDDRLGFLLIVRALELLSEWYYERKLEIVVLGSVQEEVGTRGATMAAHTLDADWFIAVDVTHGRTPDAPSDRVFETGGGPAIGVGPNIARCVSDKLVSLAREKDIKYQLEVMEGNTGTNAWPAQVSRCGVSTGVLSIALKYMHTPVETIDLEDFELTARLLAEYAIALSGEVES